VKAPDLYVHQIIVSCANAGLLVFHDDISVFSRNGIASAAVGDDETDKRLNRSLYMYVRFSLSSKSRVFSE